MKQLIKEKRWAELRACCLEKLLAGEYEEVIDELLNEIHGLCDQFYVDFTGTINPRVVEYEPITEELPQVNFHPASTSVTWKYLEDADQGDVVPVYWSKRQSEIKEDLQKSVYRMREEIYDSVFYQTVIKKKDYTNKIDWKKSLEEKIVSCYKCGKIYREELDDCPYCGNDAIPF